MISKSKYFFSRIPLNNNAIIWISVAIIFWVSLLTFHEGHFIALSVFSLVAFFVLIYLVVRETRAWRIITKLNTRTVIVVLSVSLVFLIIFGRYISQYNFIPLWDMANYWRGTLLFNQSLESGAVSALKQLYVSINTEDYNQILCWIMSFPVYLLPTWKGAVFSELCLATIPTALLLAGFITGVLDRGNGAVRSRIFVCAYVFSLSVPLFLAPVLEGYFDGMVALLFVALTVSLLDGDLPKRRCVSMVFVGFALCGVFLIRRWFVFGVIGLTVAASLYWLFTLITEKRDCRFALFTSLCLRVVVMAVAFGLPLILFFRPFLARSTGGDYSQSYHSWTYLHSYGAKFGTVIRNVGPIWLLLGLGCFIGVVVLGRRVSEDNKFVLRRVVALSSALFVGTIVTALVFWRIQDFGPHHWYVIIFFIIMFVGLPLFACVTMIRSDAWMRTSYGAVFALSVLSMLQGVSILAIPAPVSYALAQHSIVKPVQQHDVGAKQDLIAYLQKQTKGEKLVYFATASSNVNADLAMNVLLPNVVSNAFPVAAADVDSRDGFNTDFFDADYVVTSRPVSLHMAPENERVVVTLNKLVQDHSSYLGRHYSKAASFSFDNGVTVNVYRKTSAVTADDVRKLRSHFEMWYSNFPDLFANRFDDYLSHMQTPKS